MPMDSLRLRPVLKAIVAQSLRAIFRVEVQGLEHVSRTGGRKIVVANHQSFLDAVVIGAFLPDDAIFAVNAHIAKKWWVKPALALVDFAAIDPSAPMALKTLARAVQSGRPLVLFPEGRLTVTGSLMKVYDGAALVADKTDAELVPVRLDGLQYTFFTHLKGLVRRRLAPKVRMIALPPRRLHAPASLVGRARRRPLGLQLYDLMSETIFSTTVIDKTLFRSLVEATRLNGRRRVVVEDIDFAPLTYGGLLAKAFILGRKFTEFANEAEIVGVLLPNSVGAMIAFFGLQARGCVPAMLNPTAGPQGVLAACRVADVKLVLTARRFVDRAKLADLVRQIEIVAKVVYVDELATSLSGPEKLAGLFASYFPSLFYREQNANKPAVVLFTSGSEGAPKGVALSHRNLQANRRQVEARIAFNRQDVVFNALPMFHSFGLTIGTLLPALGGVRAFTYPSPLHYRIIPELVYRCSATIFFGTDTFLRGYARTADAYDFHSVRLVVAGAERVSPDNRRTWGERFGLRILEGYGATETSPVIAFNTPMHYCAGSVGRLMPGIEHRLEPTPGMADGGRLHVRGPNVMLGYMRESEPGRVEPVEDGWYDTGDIVSIDSDGFVKILGRAKRFAKIAGEMASLGAVEDLAARLSPSFRHAAIARPDERKGEQIVLVTEDPDLTRERYCEFAGAAGAPEVAFPRSVSFMARLPLLGLGKTDYPALERLLHEKETV
jgi:acyl-[acyl-carrier-protein]-phospholipid O-acyltransferase / long-chain-fatty-acid--[acyl-carrier-protein] ligase